VADSGADKMKINLESWMAMNSHLGCKGSSGSTLPVVVQFNKQDLPNAMSPDRLRNLLNLNGHPTIAAIANQGTGVFDTLKLITVNVMTKAQQEFS
jgi:signal recognition particle receptor subunit beta